EAQDEGGIAGICTSSVHKPSRFGSRYGGEYAGGLHRARDYGWQDGRKSAEGRVSPSGSRCAARRSHPSSCRRRSLGRHTSAARRGGGGGVYLTARPRRGGSSNTW